VERNLFLCGSAWGYFQYRLRRPPKKPPPSRETAFFTLLLGLRNRRAVPEPVEGPATTCAGYTLALVR